MTKTPGIFNPFAKKKKKKPKFKSAFDEIDTESGRINEPTAQLDGETYVIEIRGIKDPKKIGPHLVALLYAVNREHQEELEKNGVRIFAPNEPASPTADELVLKQSNGSVCVYVGNDDKNEEAVFRRIGYALTKLPITDLLSKYKTRVYRRG